MGCSINCYISIFCNSSILFARLNSPLYHMGHLVLTPPSDENRCEELRYQAKPPCGWPAQNPAVGSPFFILVSTIGSSGKARTKASESARKAVLKGLLLKDYQQNRLALSSIIDNTVGEDHRGLVRSHSNLLKLLNIFLLLLLCTSCNMGCV